MLATSASAASVRAGDTFTDGFVHKRVAIAPNLGFVNFSGGFRGCFRWPFKCGYHALRGGREIFQLTQLLVIVDANVGEVASVNLATLPRNQRFVSPLRLNAALICYLIYLSG
jgi:hypothetical protein